MAYSDLESLDGRLARELHALYQQEWWTKGRTLEDVRCMLEGESLCFAVRHDPSGDLAAFARVVTDGVYKALIFDVIVAPAHRGRGLGERLLRRIEAHPRLAGVRHHELYCLPEMTGYYERLGFTAEVGGVVLMRATRGRDSAGR